IKSQLHEDGSIHLCFNDKGKIISDELTIKEKISEINSQEESSSNKQANRNEMIAFRNQNNIDMYLLDYTNFFVGGGGTILIAYKLNHEDNQLKNINVADIVLVKFMEPLRYDVKNFYAVENNHKEFNRYIETYVYDKDKIVLLTKYIPGY